MRARLLRTATAVVAGIAALGSAGCSDSSRPSEPSGPTTPAVREVAAPPATTTPAPPPRPVAAAVPTRFRFSAPGVTVKARVCAMDYVLPLDPPGEQHHTVCWVREKLGTKPGSSTGTSYILGHSWAPDPDEVLNRVSEPATLEFRKVAPVKREGVSVYPIHRWDGAVMTLWTKRGRLDYTVRDAYAVDKFDLGKLDRTLDGSVRNRIVLITCAEANGTDYHYNVVLEATLSSYRAS